MLTYRCGCSAGLDRVLAAHLMERETPVLPSSRFTPSPDKDAGHLKQRDCT